MNIDKDIERCKELIRELGDYKLNRIEDSISLSKVLSELDKRGKRLNRQFKLFQRKDKETKKLKTELETYKKITQKLAEYAIELEEFAGDERGISFNSTVEELINEIRKEVEK